MKSIVSTIMYFLFGTLPGAAICGVLSGAIIISIVYFLSVHTIPGVKRSPRKPRV